MPRARSVPGHSASPVAADEIHSSQRAKTTPSPYPASRAGTDESGKGDYFGPLVVAAVAADFGQTVQMSDWGIADSKTLSDTRVGKLARQITDAAIPVAVVTIGPERYNQMHAQMKNLNRLLAWGHARAIENLLEKTTVDLIIADQFGDESLIERALLERGRQVRLLQMPRGERDIVVAAASVIARAEFLRRLAQLSEDLGMPLPKGAGAPVDQAAANIIARLGEPKLATVSKWHFKNTAKARALAMRTDADRPR
ncbi:MAG: ribonuclease HIII [candidate division Zixibacteria bacterium]|nr:ribonuclease HIII [candidate division Zixibacteria bacterium]